MYLQPWLNGQHPDLVLLHPDRGIVVFEIKDWDPARGRYFIDDTSGRPILKGVFPGVDRPVALKGRDNPFEQASRYKKYLLKICLDFAGQRGYYAVSCGVIFTKGDYPFWRRLADAMGGQPGAKTWQRPEVLSQVPGCVFLGEDFLPDPKNAMNPQLANLIRPWLREPDFNRVQRFPLPLSGRVSRLILGNPGTTGGRRVVGPAGCGKSFIIAGRAAALAANDKDVLVVGFNITLRWYLHDLAVRHLRSMVFDQAHYKRAIRKMVFVHYHMLIRDIGDNEIDIAEAAGKEKFDAILIDEGADFKGEWIENLCGILGPSERMMAYDCTQNLYGRPGSWIHSGSSVACFNMNPTRIDESYRVHDDMVPVLSDFANRYLRHLTIDVPSPVTEPHLPMPLYLRWVQTSDSEDVDVLLTNEVRSMVSSLPDDSSVADIVVLLPEHLHGIHMVQAIHSDLGIEPAHVFGEGCCVCDSRGRNCEVSLARGGDGTCVCEPRGWQNCQRCRESRVRKLSFQGGSGQLKAATYHSFKGWEARHLILFVDDLTQESDRVAFYVGLSRLVRNENGSSLTVVSICDALADFGRKYFIRNFEDRRENIFCS